MSSLRMQEQLTLDSREVADMVEKKHCHLVRDIEKFSEYLQPSLESNFGLNEFFIKSSYKDSIGRTLPCYLITRKGCEFIAHKMTGRKGSLFTAAYINKFHEMEDRIQNKPVPKKKLRDDKLDYNEYMIYSKTDRIPMDQEYIDRVGLDRPYNEVKSIILGDTKHINTLYEPIEEEPEEPPQIIPKYYRGVRVVTVQDIVDLSGLSRTTIRYHIKKLKEETDYFVVEGADLFRFKRENPCLCKVMNSITVITKSGFQKLAKYVLDVEEELPSLPEKQLPEKPKLDKNIELDPITNRLFDIWVNLNELQKAEAFGYMNRMMA